MFTAIGDKDAVRADHCEVGTNGCIRVDKVN